MIENDLFLRACRRESVSRIPVWYMRQAGRYQPDYRDVRKRYSLIEICENPEICVQVTLSPVKQLGVDAAILFSDIMVPIAPMGMPFEIQKDRGPVMEHPIRQASDIERLRPIDPESDLPYVLETIRILARELKVPLLGFAGGPFTLASYMIEGGPSRDYLRTKAMMYGEPKMWYGLMDRLGDMVITYLRAQIQAGASAVQIFDSWVGSLAPDDYAEYVLPTMERIFSELADLHAPRIYFGVTTGELLPLFAKAGADVYGVDWRVPIRTARGKLGRNVAIQGNLDPAVLLAPWPEIQRRAESIIDMGIEQPGFVFNLGHGVFPSVSGEQLQRLTTFVHEYSERALRG
ncbi:MAG: uroporphyrinogen decarboxylase [Acidibacillus sp.]|uniref:Uroporphyrinogen decarboxylase n=1 Tax=Sulfoacidibacillus ferrooxidans TaxID=2005001 RepID=A0A9X1V6B7_9BACL|nr:uroporphyrinogen decarboxylase [Sulfoacidibacillus ferrooxidans]MCI0181997.1 Uroporphyrinogen decarboxylase [Sulfoacidibacillus ferrooxidans]MCY0892373.1 uroporphyrinogen decarboxylase [Acidibacillus sp.]